MTLRILFERESERDPTIPISIPPNNPRHMFFSTKPIRNSESNLSKRKNNSKMVENNRVLIKKGLVISPLK